MVDEKKEHERKYEVNNLAEAFTLLGKIFDSNDKLGLTALSRCMCFTKNKTFRILATLEYYGIVKKDLHNNYGIGFTALAVARKILDKSSTLKNVQPYLQTVAEALNEAVYFACKDNDRSVLVDFVDCNQLVKATSFIGRSCIFPGYEKHDCNVKRLVNIGDIIVDVGGLDPDISTVSAPILMDDGVTLGAIIVLAPTFRMSLERIKTEVVPVLREVADRHSLTRFDKRKNPSHSFNFPAKRDSEKRQTLFV